MPFLLEAPKVPSHAVGVSRIVGEPPQPSQQWNPHFGSIVHFVDVVFQTNTSSFVSAEVLSKYDNQLILHPVVFFSKKYITAEENHQIYHLEIHYTKPRKPQSTPPQSFSHMTAVTFAEMAAHFHSFIFPTQPVAASLTDITNQQTLQWVTFTATQINKQFLPLHHVKPLDLIDITFTVSGKPT
jgi:hypothetical protein